MAEPSNSQLRRGAGRLLLDTLFRRPPDRQVSLNLGAVFVEQRALAVDQLLSFRKLGLGEDGAV